MVDRNKVTELLKNYKSYKFAVRNYEQAGWAAIGSVGDREFSGAAYGSRAPKKFGPSFQDSLDYQSYKSIVDIIEGALDTLDVESQEIIRLKWFEGYTLQVIANRHNYSIDTVKRKHKKALNNLVICFTFVQAPEIEKVPA